jgi:hypothetical protein
VTVFDGISMAIVFMLAAAWLLQIWLSSQQMRTFHKKSQQLRRIGTHMSIPQVVGLSLGEVGKGEPPAGVSKKTWASLDHAAGFIRNKLAKEAAAAAANGEEEVG